MSTTTLHEKELVAQYRARCEELTRNLKIAGEEISYWRSRGKGLEFITKPSKSGLFVIERVNLGWLRAHASNKIWGKHHGTTIKKGFNSTNKDGTHRATDKEIEPIAVELVAMLERDPQAADQYITRSLGEVVGLFRD